MGVKNYPTPKTQGSIGGGFSPAVGNTSGVGHYTNPPSSKSPNLGDAERIRSSFKNSKHPTAHCRPGMKGGKGGY